MNFNNHPLCGLASFGLCDLVDMIGNIQDYFESFYKTYNLYFSIGNGLWLVITLDNMIWMYTP